jgi:hypothetical protein
LNVAENLVKPIISDYLKHAKTRIKRRIVVSHDDESGRVSPQPDANEEELTTNSAKDNNVEKS